MSKGKTLVWFQERVGKEAFYFVKNYPEHTSELKNLFFSPKTSKIWDAIEMRGEDSLDVFIRWTLGQIAFSPLHKTKAEKQRAKNLPREIKRIGIVLKNGVGRTSFNLALGQLLNKAGVSFEAFEKIEKMDIEPFIKSWIEISEKLQKNFLEKTVNNKFQSRKKDASGALAYHERSTAHMLKKIFGENKENETAIIVQAMYPHLIKKTEHGLKTENVRKNIRNKKKPNIP